MWKVGRIALLVALPLGLVVPLACGEERPTCYEGDFLGCTCPNGQLGYKSCSSEERYSVCTCDGTTPGLDASFEEDADADAPGVSSKLPFMSTCTTNEECESGNCHLFSMQGSFCTQSCKVITDCPAPSTGCNNRGICKAP